MVTKGVTPYQDVQCKVLNFHGRRRRTCSLPSPYQLMFIMVAAGEEPDPVFTIICFGPESVNTYESIVQCSGVEGRKRRRRRYQSADVQCSRLVCVLCLLLLIWRERASTVCDAYLYTVRACFSLRESQKGMMPDFY